MWSDFVEICTSYYSRRVRHCFKNFFENSNFYRKRTFPKFALFFSFCPTLRPFLSVKEAKIQKTKYFKDKTMPSSYPKIANSRPYLVPIFQEKYDYFLSYFGRFLVKKGAWSHFKGPEWNIQISKGSRISKGFVRTISRSWVLWSQRTFFSNFEPLVQVWLLF